MAGYYKSQRNRNLDEFTPEDSENPEEETEDVQAD